MDKILKIGETKVNVSMNAGIIMLYKTKFNRDFFKDMVALDTKNKDGSSGEQINFITRVTYIIARMGKDELAVNSTYEEFITNFEISELMNSFKDVSELLLGNLHTDNIKKKTEGKKLK